MAVDCTDVIAVRNKVCNNATDMEEMIIGGVNDLTTNYGAKTIAGLVKETVEVNLQALGIDYILSYVWADETERNAETGMTLNEYGLQLDTNQLWQYNGTDWILNPSNNNDQAYFTSNGKVYKYETNQWLEYYDLVSQQEVDNIYNTLNNAKLDKDFSTLATKITPIDNDTLVINDSEDNNNTKVIPLSEVGGDEVSTTIEAKDGLIDNKYISPLKLRQGLNASGTAPIYACRAWVNFNGTGTVTVLGSGNVSSVTDGGVGIYTVNFITAMQNTNYNVTTGFTRVGTNDFVHNGATATTSQGLEFWSNGVKKDSSGISITVKE